MQSLQSPSLLCACVFIRADHAGMLHQPVRLLNQDSTDTA